MAGSSMLLAASGLYARYLEPIGDGLLVFLGIAVLLAVPFVILQYRRSGRVDPRSVWVAGSFLLFLVCAWALVLLPFPADIAKYCASNAGKVNLRPFIWVSQAIEEARREGTGVLSILTNSPLVVRVFNVLLLLPLGVYLRRWWGRGWVATALIAFGLSLAFELTQVTAIWGLYDCQYRTFDVDDLIANTAGALLGWLAAPAFRIIPERRSLPVEPRPVRASMPRRFVATLVDYVLALMAGGLVVAGLGAVGVQVDAAATVRASLALGLVIVTVLVPALRHDARAVVRAAHDAHACGGQAVDARPGPAHAGALGAVAARRPADHLGRRVAGARAARRPAVAALDRPRRDAHRAGPRPQGTARAGLRDPYRRPRGGGIPAAFG